MSLSAVFGFRFTESNKCHTIARLEFERLQLWYRACLTLSRAWVPRISPHNDRTLYGHTHTLARMAYRIAWRAPFCHLAMHLPILHDNPTSKSNLFGLTCTINKTFHLDARLSSRTTQNTAIFWKLLDFKNSQLLIQNSKCKTSFFKLAYKWVNYLTSKSKLQI